jgi:radical SAM protein with 4Fe4S-binding SPASM domain
MTKISNKYSNYKIAWFPDKLKSFIDSNITFPIYVRLKPTNRCNHKCFFCVYNPDFSEMHQLTSRKDELSKDKLLEIIEDFYVMDVKAVTLSGGGEPLLHPDINEVMKRINGYKIDLSTITNGFYLSGETAEQLTTAKWVRISADYYNEESFIKSRGTSGSQYNSILQNIKKFKGIKTDTCNLTMNFIITNTNYNHLIDAAKLFMDAGIEHIRFSPVWTPNLTEYHKPIKTEVLSQLEIISSFTSASFETSHSYNIDTPTYKRSNPACYFCQIVPVIAADYNVYTCHNMAYTAEGKIGSIKDARFIHLWKSKKTAQFFKNFNAVERCIGQCANENKNKIIQQILDGYGDNFV